MTSAADGTRQRILCIRLSGLGDVVHALNALSLLRRRRPHAEIWWVVEDRFADLLHGHPHIDELVTVPRSRWSRMAKRPWLWLRLRRETRKIGRRLRQRGFHVSVDFQSSVKSSWIVRAARAPLRVGFGRGVNRELNHLAQNCLVEVPTEGLHRIERDLALLAPLGIVPEYVPPQLPRRDDAAQWAQQALEGRPAEGPLVIIHPGTSRWASFKRWSARGYAAVADHLARERGAQVLVTWGPEDRELADQVVRSMREPGLLSPRTASLQQLCALLRRAELFIGSDTGPMHIASALGVPVVALFGPKDPVQTGPFCSRSVVVTGSAACRPCTRRRCPHPRCMTTIQSEQVWRAAAQVLDGGGLQPVTVGPVAKAFVLREKEPGLMPPVAGKTQAKSV